LKIYIIRPSLKIVETFELKNGLEEIKKIIGFDTIANDEIDNKGNMLVFDENCFIRDNKNAVRFQIGGLAPVAGVGVLVRFLDAKGISLAEPSFSVEYIQPLVKFL
jgi:hypothetical protein